LKKQRQEPVRDKEDKDNHVETTKYKWRTFSTSF